jgi:alkanesulfonate monooxygenase SsuD/methylene tetrahydromethanopterin reductase-like flavin-dependent oxidoreductase (luciferase family)
MFAIGLTDHLEGAWERASGEVFGEVAELVRLADGLGVEYAWFAEHHAHAHCGHLPTPLLFALHLAGQTKQIRLGTAIVCLNLHNPLDVAEQMAVADVLSGGRMAPGFGSGSTPEECELFGAADVAEAGRHTRFEESLQIIRTAWSGKSVGGSHRLLPIPNEDLAERCWVAVNSVGAAGIAGRMQFNMLFSHLRTPQQYGQYRKAYKAAGGTGKIAANRPVYVGKDDQTAMAQAEPALRILWKRFREEGKIPAGTAEPESAAELCGHPINFIVGGADTVARELRELHAQSPFDVANVELRWAGLSHELVRESLRRLMQDVLPVFR